MVEVLSGPGEPNGFVPTACREIEPLTVAVHAADVAIRTGDGRGFRFGHLRCAECGSCDQESRGEYKVKLPPETHIILFIEIFTTPTGDERTIGTRLAVEQSFRTSSK